MYTYYISNMQSSPQTPINSEDLPNPLKKVKDNLSVDTMTKIRELVKNCSDAISEGHLNAREAYKYKKQLETFLAKNSVFNDKQIDYKNTNPKVNYEEIMDNKEKKYYYVGNHDRKFDIATDLLGRWTENKNWMENSDYVYEGKWKTDSKNDIKVMGVEQLQQQQQTFYGKFEEGKRTSGVYVWTNDKYIGKFDCTIKGYGCYKLGDAYIFGKFTTDNYKTKLPDQYLKVDKDSEISWNINNEATQITNEDKANVLKILDLEKVKSEIKELSQWEKTFQELEEKTGFNRTSLYATAAFAALGIAGVGIWAYKKLMKRRRDKVEEKSSEQKSSEEVKEEKPSEEVKEEKPSEEVKEEKPSEEVKLPSQTRKRGRKPAANKSVSRKNNSATKTAATKASATKASATKAAATKAAATKAAATKASATKASATKASATKASATKAAATKASATKAAATKAAATKAAATNVEGERRSQRIREKESSQSGLRRSQRLKSSKV